MDWLQSVSYIFIYNGLIVRIHKPVNRIIIHKQSFTNHQNMPTSDEALFAHIKTLVFASQLWANRSPLRKQKSEALMN